MFNKLLKKPENYRRKVAFIATAILGIIIFSIWIIITQYNVKQALNPSRKDIKTASQQFRESLPSLDNNQAITTELMKQQKDINTK